MSTPITDASSYRTTPHAREVVPAEKMRRLERLLAEAMEAMSDLSIRNQQKFQKCNAVFNKYAELKKEMGV